MISAEVILDSISPNAKRLTTIKCIYPWFIHGEVMTHRVFSRNASSNRAVPTAKLLAEVRDPKLRAVPSFSVVNAPGMQGGRPTTEQERLVFISQWHDAALAAADAAEEMSILAAKQDVNRLLMPFTHARVLISATEWDNFFGLRLDKNAQPEARMLAQVIWVAMKKSSPLVLTPGRDWHLPYILAQDAEGDWPLERLIKVSVARCARVSYESFETGKLSTIDEDLRLYDRLMGAQPLHASPAEHQATPDTWHGPKGAEEGYWPAHWGNPEQHGNFKGWRQYRKMLPGEAIAPLPKEYVDP